MKLNKYLAELGIKEYDLPGNYDPDLIYPTTCAAADIRNKEDEEGFCTYEFFSLDHTFDLIIYSKLCYFREHYANIATPGCFLYDRDGNKLKKGVGEKRWLKTLDTMIEGFKVSLTIDYPNKELEKKINKGRQLFIKYYNCLWY